MPTSSLHCGDYAALSAGVFGLFFSFSLLSPLWALRGAMAQVIAFAWEKGGTGKSLLAQGFAVEVARQSAAVALFYSSR